MSPRGHVEHVPGRTWHGRRGAIRNAFAYSVDYVLLDAEAPVAAPLNFSRNRRNIASVQDRDHGGPPGAGRGPSWAREVLRAHQVRAEGPLLLLTQPRLLGHVFNPVSFWLAHDHIDRLVAVIAEVSNTFGDRHSYLCVHPESRPIRTSDVLQAQKIFHVSPFQPVEGTYRFRFSITAERVAIRIDYGDGADGGLVATLAGPRRPLSSGALLRAMLRRPFGSRRVLALIHWQAIKLWWKGAVYRARPVPPAHDVS
ncbi:DUF1365 domain-containing protein [Roseivivax marinus]|uniref:DUF1365 domain-containing protein n=1 Tax=Roseivivax marinus TaxID=1379903 RepID=UPI001F045915|nr:DUF1365 domain-containing protein [Roseivivax marinus]UMA64962.1 DUF1365 domain-containing protein [Roseivivax marinus]